MGFKSNKYMTSMKKSKGMLKTLSISALVGAAFLGATNSAQANETPITPTLGDNSAYTLNPISQPTDNSVTLYKYDNTGITESINYEINLNQAEYGTGDNKIFYNYKKDANTGDYSLVETTDEQNAEFIIKYDTQILSPIKNSSTIESVTSDFVGNVGNPLYNSGTINSITGDFISNYSEASRSYSAIVGGAIYNSGDIGTITGNFVSNCIYNTGSHRPYAKGGAIYNSGTIDNINASFINNILLNNNDSDAIDLRGAAIKNEENATIGNITGDFIANKAYTVIENYGHIESLSGNFIRNEAPVLATTYNSTNKPSVGKISGYFIENTGFSVLWLRGKVDEIDAVFINNKGHAIHPYAQASLGDINGIFIGNSTSDSSAGGGAIYNTTSSIGNITADFVGNYSVLTKVYDGTSSAEGGAISNENSYANATIKNITGNFVANYVLGARTHGGAIYNNGTIDSITGDFIANYASNLGYGNQIEAIGGAIYNDYSSHIGVVRGDFIANYVESEVVAIGGAIYNECELGQITNSTFVNNYAKSETGIAQGGAIYNSSNDSFDVAEDALVYGDIAILNDDGSVYKSLYIVADSTGSSYYTEAQIQEAIQSGAIKKLEYFGRLEQISKSDFDEMLAGEGVSEADWLAMAENEGYLQTNPEVYFPEDNDVKVLIIDDVRAFKSSLNIKNTNFVRNYAESKNGEAKGGAIFASNTTVKFDANNGETTLISGNYTKNGEEIDDNAIYMNGGKLIFDVTNGSTIQLDDNINGQNYETYIIGDNQSKFLLNNKIKNSITHLIDTNLYLTKDSHLDGNNLGLHSGTLNMINNQVGVSALNSLTVTGDTNVNVDVDLKNQTMDRFTASEYGSHSGNLNVTGMNLLSDAVSDNTEILFAEQGLKDNVTNGITTELPDSKYQSTVYTPIYKYNVAYDNRDDAGYFVFARQASSSGNQSEVFNPAVLGSSTSATVGAVGTINQTFNYAFSNADTHMNIPYLERVSMRDRNKYALSLTGDATDMGRYSPLFQPSDESSSVWVKPYATFENVPLKNGPKVSNITYGTLVGFDSEMQSLRRGWDRVWTGYIGYNGASQRYSGIDSTQNGGLIGGTMTLYKGNFFNATTLSVGANVANNQTMYGSEDFAMLLSGIGNKTGYNFEFKEGKLILQPSMLMSYTFVNTFDYTNAAGVRIDNKPLHALQLAPGVKVIGNLKGGWQPYASVSMVWNLMGESDATANGVKLPEMSIKPYVQYGVGLQKRIKDHFMAYGQAMVQNGGRNGVSLTAGFRWALGHDNCKYKVEDKQLRGKAAKSKCHSELDSESINANNKTSALGVGGVMPRAAEHKKILKQMTPEQRAAYGGKYQNTSRTAKSGSLRQY